MAAPLEITNITGGCLCGAVRYEISTSPKFAGFCYCADCRKASGSAFVPFMGFDGSAIKLTGETREHHGKSASGGTAVRNFCPSCGSLLFGGIYGTDDEHTVYAGSLDDITVFKPNIAMFTQDRPDWAKLECKVKEFKQMPEE
jgi:hypothetical protein